MCWMQTCREPVFGGSQRFVDGGLRGDAGTHLRLRFTYNSVAGNSNEFNVRPSRVHVSVLPSDGKYGAMWFQRR